jgi:uncharacterized membrane protein
MADDQFGDEKPPANQDEATELVLSPPSGRPIVADTAGPMIDRAPVSASHRVSSEALLAEGLQYLSHKRETRIHQGPLPDPATLRELAEIYANAPKLIFEEFRAQSNHRREMERSTIQANIKAMLRGQVIGGLIGGAGVVGSLIIAGMGHGWAGFGIATSSLVGLVSVFVRGRQAQERERLEKERLRGRIAKGHPIEELEEVHPPD